MNLTVEEVIKKGVSNRNKNALITLLIIPLIIYCGVKDLDIKHFLLGLFIIILILIVRQITSEQNWRIWALQNVDNPQEFKIIASELYLIPRNNKVFNKFEFHTSRYKEIWTDLQKRYDEQVENDPLNITNSGLTFERNFINILFMKPTQLFRNKKKCELYIDNKKITINDEKTYFWENITNEEIFLSYFDSRYKDTTVNILRFEYNNELIEIPLCYYKINEHYLIRVIETIRKSKSVIRNKPAPNINLIDLANVSLRD